MAAAKKRTASEIDDIFAAKKPKPSLAAPAAQKPAGAATSTAAAPAATGTAASGPAKKKAKKDKAAGAVAEAPAQGKADKLPAAPSKRVPETIIDTSKAIETYKPEPLIPKTLRENATDEERKAAEEEERFMDSRGTRKKTEDGLPIYSFDELRIGFGGDTPECPFECTCCF
ncbi:hypothetical protein JCM10450v2_005468 [Rhodotorula kratochvilovae]